MSAKEQAVLADLYKLPDARVLCLGDVMLDRFVYGSIDRISPEAPIPVLKVEREKHMLGGSGNVVANISALGAQATLLAVIGDDAAGGDIQKQLEAAGIASALEKDALRATTVKSRFVCGSQQMLRVDREKTEYLSAAVEGRVIARIDALIAGARALILSDYQKGLLTDRIIAAAIAAAKKKNIPVIVDPKGRDFSRYRGADIITPNRKELETATGMKAGTDTEVVAAAQKLIAECGIGAVLVTRSKDGLSLVAKDKPPVHIPARVREVYDVSGAGDTVIAVFASALASGLVPEQAAILANAAAGVVVGKAGTATARIDEIADALSEDATLKSKRMDMPRAAEQVERLKARGLKIGFTNGCFDLLHPGHLSLLRQAKEACGFLIVAINSDASVKRLKGPARPVQNESARAEILAALDLVDMVVIFSDDTPIELIRALRPDVLVKGGQYKLEEVVGYDIVASYGGTVVRAAMEDGFSTTNTIALMHGGTKT